MVKVKIKNLKSFENFLTVAGKIVQQGELIIRKDFSSLYCKNTRDFSTARLLLDTNAIIIDEKESIDLIKICLKDITALRSSINIIQIVEQVNEAELQLEEVMDEDEYYARLIKYDGKAKFKLITIDIKIIEPYVSKDITVELNPCWKFYINPVNLDIIQNRTGNIVNVQEDVSVYLTKNEQNQVVIDLASKNANYINSISLPIADTCTGKLPDSMPCVAIHDSTLRLLNILKVTEENALECFFDDNYNIFYISSMIELDRMLD